MPSPSSTPLLVRVFSLAREGRRRGTKERDTPAAETLDYERIVHV